jgi:hypothetical protein
MFSLEKITATYDRLEDIVSSLSLTRWRFEEVSSGLIETLSCHFKYIHFIITMTGLSGRR